MGGEKGETVFKAEGRTRSNAQTGGTVTVWSTEQCPAVRKRLRRQGKASRIQAMQGRDLRPLSRVLGET